MLKMSSSRICCTIAGCHSTFRRKYELERHVKSVHSSAATYKCHFCERSVRRKDKFLEHLRNVHSIWSDSDLVKTNFAFGNSLDPSLFISASNVAPGDTIRKESPSTGSLTGETIVPRYTSSISNQPRNDGWVDRWQSTSPVHLQAGTVTVESCMLTDSPRQVLLESQ